MKWKIFVIPVLLLIIVVSACFLIPQEEQLPTSPPIYKSETSAYEFTTVVKGDLVYQETLYCTYNTIKEEWYSFKLSGYGVQNFYIKTGDAVKKGDLLASLDMSDLQNQIDSCNESIESLQLKLDQLVERKNLEYKQQNDYRETLSDDELEKTLTAEEKVLPYATQISEIEDNIWIQNLKKDEIEQKISDRQIICGMDGVVGYVKDVDEKYKSEKGHDVIKIYDENSSAFVATNKFADLVQVGDEFTVTIDDLNYDIVAVSANEYGIEDSQDDSKSTYYFKLKEPSSILVNGDRGILNITIEESKNTLYLPEDAIRLYKGEQVVYYQNEQGIRELKYIETGLVSDGYVEIISGVEEGELIILA